MDPSRAATKPVDASQHLLKVETAEKYEHLCKDECKSLDHK